MTRVRKSDRPLAGYRAGDRIGEKYELLRERGAGGMGAVWVARNTVLDAELAIKLISVRSKGSAASMTERLLEEARAAARLGHSSIVRVHDFGQTAHGDPFIAMELLDGEDLADVLARVGQLRSEQAVALLLPIAHALVAAHDKQIVHRDVKPENIFLAKAEAGVVPKLLDFGIARVIDSPKKQNEEGAVLGTPEYMSPEQARGDDAGPATDVWSLCVVLYEAVTGACPFEAGDYGALLRAIIEDEPAPAPELDPALWAIVRRGLNKAPEERWRSMRDLGEALAWWLFQRGLTEDVTGTSLRRTWLRDTETSGQFDLSARSSAPFLTSPALSVSRISGEHPAFPSARRVSVHSEPQLEAIAELNRGGDPVELIKRAERRRIAVLAAVVTGVVLASSLAILIGTGIIVL